MSNPVKVKSAEGVYTKELGKKFNGKPDISYSIRYPDKNTGKIINKVIGRKSEGVTVDICKAKRLELVAEYQKNKRVGLIKDINSHKVLTLDEVFDIYMYQRKGKLKNPTKTLSQYKDIKEWFGKEKITDISNNDILKFRAYLLDDKFLANKTINDKIAFMKTVLNVAVDEGYLASNPIKIKYDDLQVDNERARYLSLKEIDLLLDTVKKDRELSMFVKISLATGARLNTVLSIKYSDINFALKQIKLEDHKRRGKGKPYIGYMDDELSYQIKAKMKTADSQQNNLINYNTKQVQRRLKKIFDATFNLDLDVKDRENRVVTHTLRHTFASQLAISGVSIYKIKELMNHARIEQTVRYAKLAKNSGQDDVQAFLAQINLTPGNIDDFE